MKKLRSFIRLMRPKHYLKNALVFVPLVYSFNLTNADLFFKAAVCYVALCLIASGIYAINDIIDYEKDKAHPKNKMRPIAAGEISKSAATNFAFFLFATGFGLITYYFGIFHSPPDGWWSHSGPGVVSVLFFCGLYVILNLVYSFNWKHVAIIDCFCIAAGFVLRIFIGGAAIGLTNISEWMFLTIAAGSLFMAFGKRRGELIQLGETGRKVLNGYNLEFLNGAVFSCAAISIIFYALWAMTSESQMVYTVPLIIFIICKYLLNTHTENSYGDPVAIIFGDKVLIGAIVVFGLLSILFLYPWALRLFPGQKF
ncbi:MAG: decaprenyl-phosphate phosphoribosyltransferase [Defluviitaleaceae bacterium]|nr:decaprenyl-phosphate phosphoribosyltransferase [Defluviitaleaceae bacterium]